MIKYKGMTEKPKAPDTVFEFYTETVGNTVMLRVKGNDDDVAILSFDPEIPRVLRARTNITNQMHNIRYMGLPLDTDSAGRVAVNGMVAGANVEAALKAAVQEVGYNAMESRIQREREDFVERTLSKFREYLRAMEKVQ